MGTGVGDNRVWLSCADTGSGISRENLDRIFDAFFTTKPVGKGTDLGLHITHRIIEDCGGEIQVQSQPGLGTTFTLYLPIASARDEALAESEDLLLAPEELEQPVRSGSE